MCGGFTCSKNALTALNILYIVSRQPLRGLESYPRPYLVPLTFIGEREREEGLLSVGAFLRRSRRLRAFLRLTPFVGGRGVITSAGFRVLADYARLPFVPSPSRPASFPRDVFATAGSTLISLALVNAAAGG